MKFCYDTQRNGILPHFWSCRILFRDSKILFWVPKQEWVWYPEILPMKDPKQVTSEDIEEKLGYSTEDVEDSGGAEDTESFEVDEVELPFEMVRLVDFSVTSMTSIGGCSFVGLM